MDLVIGDSSTLIHLAAIGRLALLGKSGQPCLLLVASTGIVVLLLIGGLFCFRRMEEAFADVV